MLEVGTFLADRYEIIAKVGAGGMSDVYKAKDHILGRFVAIKVLKQEYSEDRNFVTKFRIEAQSAAGLEHPNIVNIHERINPTKFPNTKKLIVINTIKGSTGIIDSIKIRKHPMKAPNIPEVSIKFIISFNISIIFLP